MSGGKDWYVGPYLHHYRCMRVYFPCTRSERVCDTVIFFPHEITFTEVKIGDFSEQAAIDIISILTSTSSTMYSILEAEALVRSALLTIAQQLQCVEALPTN